MKNKFVTRSGNKHKSHGRDEGTPLLRDYAHEIHRKERGTHDKPMAVIVDHRHDHAPHLVTYSKGVNTAMNVVQAVIVGSLITGAGAVTYKVGASVRDSVEYINEIPSAIAKEKERPDQAAGISVTRGRKTNEVFGAIYLDNADGSSFMLKKDKDGMPYLPDKHMFSITMGTFVEIISKRGNQTLWVQNILSAENAGRNSLVYRHNSEIKREPSMSKTTAIEHGIEWAFRTLPHINAPIDGIKGRGAVGIVGIKNLDEYYVYNGHRLEKSFPISMALDIKVKTRGDNVIMTFSDFPVKQEILNKHTGYVFDTVTYKVKGLEKAYIKFDKDHDTYLAITGYSDNSYLVSKNLKGIFSLYEMEKGQINPLPIDKTRVWNDSGGTTNVRSRPIGGDNVEVFTKRAKRD